MKNVSKLRGTRNYISEDLSPASQSIRKAQLPLLKQAISEGKVAYFRHTKLIKDRISQRSAYAMNLAHATSAQCILCDDEMI